MNETIGILCVDDHLIVRAGIASIVDSQPDMRVIATATTGREAIRLFRKYRPDVTLLNLELPDISCLEAIRTIRVESADARLVVVAASYRDDVCCALEAGASSCICKDDGPGDLLRVIRRVHAGERPISSQIEKLLVQHRSQVPLTPREREILQLMALGLRNKQIAENLRLSEMTIQAHNKHIFAKLKVTDRTAAVMSALRRGIIHLS